MRFIFTSDGNAERGNKMDFVFGLLLIVGLFLLVVILPKVYADEPDVFELEILELCGCEGGVGVKCDEKCDFAEPQNNVLCEKDEILTDGICLEIELKPMIDGKFPPGSIVDCIGGFYFNGVNCVPNDLAESSTYYLSTYSIPIGIIIISLIIFVYWRKRK